MAFTFSLQKALEWTLIEESAKRSEIAGLNKKIEALKAELARSNTGLRALLEDEGKRFSSDWAPFVAARVPSLAEAIRGFEADLRERERVAAEKRIELNRILMKRKGLESLKGKRLREYRLKESRREQKRLDEVHQILSNRQGS